MYEGDEATQNVERLRRKQEDDMGWRGHMTFFFSFYILRGTFLRQHFQGRAKRIWALGAFCITTIVNSDEFLGFRYVCGIGAGV